MHPEVYRWVDQARLLCPEAVAAGRTLEVGSQWINGSIKGLFKDPEYIGIDICQGRNVDIVSTASDYLMNNLSKRFAVVVSCEMLEHSRTWVEDLLSMYTLLESGGLMIVTCASTGTGAHNVEQCGGFYHNVSLTEFKDVMLETMFTKYETELGTPAHQEPGLALDLRFKGVKK